jgi:hypothetical protein
MGPVEISDMSSIYSFVLSNNYIELLVHLSKCAIVPSEKSVGLIHKARNYMHDLHWFFCLCFSFSFLGCEKLFGLVVGGPRSHYDATIFYNKKIELPLFGHQYLEGRGRG